MKISFSHLRLAYPKDNETCLEFIAETPFEQAWLKQWAAQCGSVKFDFQYPNTEPKDLNNPTIALTVMRDKK